MENQNQVTAPTSPLYVEGYPREYRFNAKTGTITHGSNTCPEEFVIVKIEVIERVLFPNQYPDKNQWIAIFFIDSANVVSCFLCHSASFRSVRTYAVETIYQGAVPFPALVRWTAELKSTPKGTYYKLELERVSDAPPHVIDFCNKTIFFNNFLNS